MISFSKVVDTFSMEELKGEFKTILRGVRYIKYSKIFKN